MTTLRADEATRTEIAEALTHLAHTAGRLPAHWADRRGALHEQINALLDAYEAAL